MRARSSARPEMGTRPLRSQRQGNGRAGGKVGRETVSQAGPSGERVEVWTRENGPG